MQRVLTLDHILIRFNHDGSVKGIHKAMLERFIEDDDRVLQTNEMPVEPVSQEDIASILGDQQSGLITHNTALQQQAAADAGTIQDLRDQVDGLTETLSAIQATRPVAREFVVAALDEAGVLDTVNSFITALPDDRDLGGGITGKRVKVLWSGSASFDLNSPIFTLLGQDPDMSLTPEQISALMERAKVLAKQT